VFCANIFLFCSYELPKVHGAGLHYPAGHSGRANVDAYVLEEIIHSTIAEADELDDDDLASYMKWRGVIEWIERKLAWSR
jgi:tRNA A-37 threonylcarbamoyl transferase component Bud32